MDAQEIILRNCQHTDRQRSDVDMGQGERLLVCCDCWNAGVTARRADRKAQLAEHWRNYREAQTKAMAEVGARPGQHVHYFCRSMLLLGGIDVTGTIALNRNGVAVVKLDRKYDGKTQTTWNKGWRPIQ
jgi:hypothetical protein